MPTKRTVHILFTLLSTLSIAILMTPNATRAAGYQTDVAQIDVDPAFVDATVIQVSDEVVQANVKRMGINVGSHTTYGAAQYLKNIVPNPGFERGEFGMIFHTEETANTQRIQADFWNINWGRLNHPVGFWEGARYEWLFGAAAGQSGTVSTFNHEENLYTFYLGGATALPAPNDILMVHTEVPGFYSAISDYNRSAPGDTRPGSLGQQSLQLLPHPNYSPSYQMVFDTLARDSDPSAGKLMVVEGEWTFKVWAKGAVPDQTLRVLFRRVGEADLLNQEIQLTTDWQPYEINFTVPVGLDSRQAETIGALELGLYIDAWENEMWIDDIELYKANQTNPTPFTDRYVNYLKEMRPGILRNWGDQLGSSLNNQLATPFERKTTGHSPIDYRPRNFHFSLHEFLVLCQEVGAEPWYVIPPTFTQAELEHLVAYLSAQPGESPYADWRAGAGQPTPWTEIFPTIHLEFGNETWGANDASRDPFVGATFRGGERAGTITNRRFGEIQAAPFYNPERFDLKLGGQTFSPPRQTELTTYSSAHDSIALAPYFGFYLWSYADDQALYNPLFAFPDYLTANGEVRQTGNLLEQAGRSSPLAFYEIGIHPTQGDAPPDIRNNFAAGLGSGLALPLTMLTYQRDLGVIDQAAYQSLQYSNNGTPDGSFVRTWGLLRDLEGTGNKRPGWLGLEGINRAIQGDMISTRALVVEPSFIQPKANALPEMVEAPYIRSFAYKEGERYGLVLFNLDLNRSHPVHLALPPAASFGNAQLTKLHGDSINANNENGVGVTLRSEALPDFRQGYEMMLAPHAMYVLTWEAAGGGNIASVAQPDILSVTNRAGGSPQRLDLTANDVAVLPNTRPVVHTQPTNGTITLERDGSIAYTPAPGFRGIDQLSYTLQTGEARSNVVTVHLLVGEYRQRVISPIVLRQ